MLPALGRRKFTMAGFLGYAASLISSYFHNSSALEKQRLLDETEPFVRHKTIHACDLDKKDLVIIGDVHGCYDEMLELLRQVEKETTKPVVKLFVGDMINKGPKSVEMLEYIKTATDAFCVRGNHEQKILKEYIACKRHNADIQESRNWVKNLSPASFDFIKNLPFTISIPLLNLIVVHAGLVPGTSLQLQNTNDMLNMRNLMLVPDDFHGEVLKATYRSDLGQPWADQWQGPQHVYFGHDAVRKLQRHKWSTGLDTGCVYGGKLTAVLFHLHDNEQGFHSKIISIDPFKVYKPVSD